MPPGVNSEINTGIEESKNALPGLRKESNSGIYFTLKPLNLLTILFTMAKAKEKGQKKAISLYLTKLRSTSPELTGKDMKGMGLKPGPLFKTILRSILEARLEGKIKSREDEMDFVKKKFPVPKK